METAAMLTTQHPLGLTAGSLSVSLSRYLTDIHCSEDESHTFYNRQKKKCFGTSERLKCSSGRSFLFFRPGTSSRVEEPLQDALNMIMETSGDASQDQDLSTCQGEVYRLLPGKRKTRIKRKTTLGKTVPTYFCCNDTFGTLEVVFGW